MLQTRHYVHKTMMCHPPLKCRCFFYARRRDPWGCLWVFNNCDITYICVYYQYFRERLRSHSLGKTGKLKISPGQVRL